MEWTNRCAMCNRKPVAPKEVPTQAIGRQVELLRSLSPRTSLPTSLYRHLLTQFVLDATAIVSSPARKMITLILYLPLGFLVLLAFCFVSSAENRETLLDRWYGLRRRASVSLTLPLVGLTAEKPVASVDSTPSPGYKYVFPPHRRQALALLGPIALKGHGPSAAELSLRPPVYTNALPDKDVCDSDNMLNHTTPTGFTVAELRRLGDFPDYAMLSGIPLPNAYEGFNIATAMPRPYRPYRWSYHQTMCEYCNL